MGLCVQSIITLKKRLGGITVVLFSVFYLNTYATTLSTPLSFSEAGRLAILFSPELKRLCTEAEALDQKAIADRQLPDPKLMAGTINVPTNNFSFTQDEMTMIMGGLEQRLPPGHSLAIKSRRTKAEAGVYRARFQEQKLALARTAHEAWLELYYWQQAAHIVQANRRLFVYLLKVAKSQYAQAIATQSDVLQVEVELSQLDEQQVQITQQIEQVRAKLGRWIGQEEARRPLAAKLPKLPHLSSLSTLKTNIKSHPLLKADLGSIQANREAVALAKEQFKPGVVFDVNYGVRQGRMPDGTPRSNMLTAQVTVDLPIFPKHRQTPRLREQFLHLESAFLDRNAHFRDLIEMLISSYAAWEQLVRRDAVFTQKLMPEAKQNAKAALLAYQSATTDMNTVLRAYSGELNIQLEQLNVEIEQLKTRVTLLYLEGKTG
ncbi:Outer membrane efflux protein [Legionella steelei]|uniref:Outer membrane efflux protein n=2 Tax=Legionella TaxID=445 RepID=A0A0W0S9J6_9GAMM|nr:MULTISPECIES: TolC family protein [Legionella]KTC80152.1 Outer membrane efflux protein [Legionella cherrii]KTD71744.1 Outer membrane efflux protein [Legionella steelei]